MGKIGLALLGLLLVVTTWTASALALPAGIFMWARFDERNDLDRASGLTAIARSLHERYGRDPHAALPDRLALAPEYQYRNLGHGDYELCTTFDHERPGADGTWAHFAKGRSCFRLSVYNRPYLDPKERSWFEIGC